MSSILEVQPVQYSTKANYIKPNSTFSYCQTYQHGGSEVKLVKELCNKDVCLHQVILVSIFHLANNLSEPLVLFLSTGNPDEEDLCK